MIIQSLIVLNTAGNKFLFIKEVLVYYIALDRLVVIGFISNFPSYCSDVTENRLGASEAAHRQTDKMVKPIVLDSVTLIKKPFR